MTSTSAPASASVLSGPSVCAATTKSRAASASGARAYQESAGWLGCTAAATAGRMVQAWLCDSSNTTRTGLLMPSTVDGQSDDVHGKSVPTVQHSVTWMRQIERFLRYWWKMAGGPTTTSAAASRSARL